MTRSRVARLLDEALARREAFLDGGAGTDAWRIINGSGDGLRGLTADRFGPAVLVEAHRDDADPKALVEAIVARFGGGTPVFLKARWSASAQERAGGQVAGPPIPSALAVREGGVAFAVELVGNEHVGLFLDSRPARELVRKIAAGRKVLNLFSYTGAFGVVAAAGGASGTTNVDNKRSALDGARVNYRINGLAHDTRTFMRSDAVRYLGRAVGSGEPFDLVVLDPPPRYARPGRPPYNSRDGYPPLAARCMAACAPDGILLAGLNDMAVDQGRFEELLAAAAALAARHVDLERVIGPGPDFPPSTDRPVARFVACRIR
jgi:23S rRNA (cytosine1962-C5)-methyltransferase